MAKAFLFLVLAMTLNGENQMLAWLAILAMFLSIIEMNGGKSWTTLTGFPPRTPKPPDLNLRSIKMSNLEIVKAELLKEFSLREVEDFLEFVKQDHDLSRLAEKNPHSPRFLEILHIALDK